jgi:hypothetical protein
MRLPNAAQRTGFDMFNQLCLIGRSGSKNWEKSDFNPGFFTLTFCDSYDKLYHIPWGFGPTSAAVVAAPYAIIYEKVIPALSQSAGAVLR